MAPPLETIPINDQFPDGKDDSFDYDPGCGDTGETDLQ